MQPMGKFVLLALADEATYDGMVAPSLDRLTRLTGLNTDAVRMALAYLEDRAFLVQERQRVEPGKGLAGMRQTGRYRIVLQRWRPEPVLSDDHVMEGIVADSQEGS